jgi:nitrite reductase/ring-hydroxylating ferredoxin subunit
MNLCHVDDLPEGTARGFHPNRQGEDSLIVVRHGSGVHVYLNDCPHQHRPLGWRKDRFLSADREYLVCFAHGARFEIERGYCVSGPCLGASLTRVPHRVDHRGVIEIE